MGSNNILDTERPFHIEQYLQLLAQSEDPSDILNDVFQLWLSDGTGTGNIGDVYAKIHQDGDPGENATHKLLDYLYASFFGEMLTVTAAATVAIVAGSYNVVYCALDQAVTFNITGGAAGHRLYFVLDQDATGGRVVTFNTNFVSNGTRVAPANGQTVVVFLYDGTNWVEVDNRNYEMPKVAVDQPDLLATPEIELLYAHADKYPNGVTILSCGLNTGQESSTYSIDYEIRDAPDDGTPTAVATVATSASIVAEDAGLSASAVAVGEYIYAILPATDVDRVNVWVSYVIN